MTTLALAANTYPPSDALNDGISRMGGALSRAFNTAKGSLGQAKDAVKTHAQTLSKTPANIGKALAHAKNSAKEAAITRTRAIKQSPATKAFTRAAAGASATIAFKSACVGAACSAGASAAVGGAAAGLTITGYQAVQDYRAAERARPKGTWATIKDFFGFLKEDDNAKKYTQKLVMNSGAAALGGYALIEFFSQAAHGDDILDQLQSHQRPSAPAPAQIPTQSHDISAPGFMPIADLTPPTPEQAQTQAATRTTIHQDTDQTFTTPLPPVAAPEMEIIAPPETEPMAKPETEPEEQYLQPAPSALEKLAALNSDDFSGRAADTLSFALKGQDWAIKEIAINLLNENNGSPLNRELATELLQIAEQSDNANIARQATRDLGIIQDLWPEAYAAATQETAIIKVAETVPAPTTTPVPEQIELPAPALPGENENLSCVSKTTLDEIQLRCAIDTNNIVNGDIMNPNISNAADIQIFHDPSSILEQLAQEQAAAEPAPTPEERRPFLTRMVDGFVSTLKEIFVPGTAHASENIASTASNYEPEQQQPPCNVSRNPQLPNLANLHCTFNGQNLYTPAAYGFGEKFALNYSPTPETLARAPSPQNNLVHLSAL